MQLSQNEKSYQGILEKIQTGSLAPGDQLVTRSLAEEFGVSLSPVREAINRLISEGLVDYTPGAGAAVKQVSLKELSELYVLREAIEPCAAGLAAELTTADDIQDLEDIVEAQSDIADALETSPKNGVSKKLFRRWISLEEEFHEAVFRFARNGLLAKVIREQRMLSRLFESHLQNKALLNADVARQTVTGKRELLELFRDRDAEQARNHMVQQIRRGRRHVVSEMRKAGMK